MKVEKLNEIPHYEEYTNRGRSCCLYSYQRYHTVLLRHWYVENLLSALCQPESKVVSRWEGNSIYQPPIHPPRECPAVRCRSWGRKNGIWNKAAKKPLAVSSQPTSNSCTHPPKQRYLLDAVVCHSDLKSNSWFRWTVADFLSAFTSPQNHSLL
jgi:hypothetical protein